MAKSSFKELLCCLIVVVCSAFCAASRPLADDGAENFATSKVHMPEFGKPQRQLLYWIFFISCPAPTIASAKAAVSGSGDVSATVSATATSGGEVSTLVMAECLPSTNETQTCDASGETKTAIASRFDKCDADAAALVGALLKAKVPFKLKPEGIYFEEIPPGVVIDPLPGRADVEQFRMRKDDAAKVEAQVTTQGNATGSASATARTSDPGGN